MRRNKNFDNKKPTIYLISTPIGNLKEFNERAIEVISSCDIVMAEDTRNTLQLLSKFNISKPSYSLREHNEKQMSEFVIEKIKEGKKIVYMSDAGYPGISDPGTILVKECIANDINVSVINGSSAFLTALVASGLDTSHFLFYGFLNAKESEASKQLDELKNKEETLIFYESPHRIETTLKLLHEKLGNREACIARELTKINEEYIYGNLEEFLSIDSSTLKGEMVIIVSGNKEVKEIDMDEINGTINLLKDKGLTNRDIVEIITKIYKIKKNLISKILY